MPSVPNWTRWAAACAAAWACHSFAFDPFQYQREGALVAGHGMATNSNDFSLVALPEEDHVKVLLERFGQGLPVNAARIRIESEQHSALAQPLGDGVYRVDDAWLRAPGKKGLVFVIEAEGQRDLLIGVFDPQALATLDQQSAPLERYSPAARPDEAQGSNQ